MTDQHDPAQNEPPARRRIRALLLTTADNAKADNAEPIEAIMDLLVAAAVYANECGPIISIEHSLQTALPSAARTAQDWFPRTSPAPGRPRH